MESPLREQFVLVIMRLKRVDICPPTTACLQQSELAVLAKAAAGSICPNKGCSAGTIQQDLHLSKPAVSQTLNNLEKKGYIVRAIDPDDRRKITVTLTAAGEQALAQSQRCYEESLEYIFARFGIENMQTLLQLANQLMDIVEAGTAYKKGGTTK